MKKFFDEAKAKELLNKGIAEAAAILKDEQRIKKLLADLDKKLRSGKLSETLEAVPLLISCLKSYAKREYTEMPVNSILAIVSALLYWLSPVDFIPDFIPGIGHVDDASVVMACLKLVKRDLDAYKRWLEQE